MNRLAQHLPAGAAIVGLWHYEPGAGISVLVLFCAYELNQDKHKRDRAYKDLEGAAWGAAAAGGILATLSVLGLLP